MKFKLYVIFGLLLTIIFISLLIDIYITQLNDYEEGFQAFSRKQVSDMSACVSGTPNCVDLLYYDTSGSLQPGSFSNLPYNFYLDGNNILQPVPSGYTATGDHKAYIAKSKTAAYTDNSKIRENIIQNPTKCRESSLITEGRITYGQEYLLDANYPYYPKTTTVCGTTKYATLDNSNNIKIITDTIIIPDGYYIAAGMVTKVPYGYSASPDKRSITITVDYQAAVSSTTYNTNNYDVTYHTDPTDETTDASTAGAGQMWILNNSGQLISVPYEDVTGTTLYNEPGSFRFGSSNYVPNYEETVYLSKLTNISTVTPVINSAEIAAGFCASNSQNKDVLEQKCNALDTNACASTSCCVLLGGQKCVHGSESGPYFKSNYSNFMITNPEFYYYQGKCYGNCVS
jgi:hypothetical protein